MKKPEWEEIVERYEKRIAELEKSGQDWVEIADELRERRDFWMKHSEKWEEIARKFENTARVRLCFCTVLAVVAVVSFFNYLAAILS